MACPSGCLNGGGQVKPKDLNMNPKEVIETLEHQIENMEYRELLPNPQENKSIAQLLQMMAVTYQNWQATSFKAVEKELTLNVKW